MRRSSIVSLMWFVCFIAIGLAAVRNPMGEWAGLALLLAAEAATRRRSVVSLMWIVCFVVVGLTALRNASNEWAGVMALLTVAAFATAVLTATQRSGGERAGWLGFALFGAVYLGLAFGPWFAEVRPHLPTTRLLHHIHDQAYVFHQHTRPWLEYWRYAPLADVEDDYRKSDAVRKLLSSREVLRARDSSYTGPNETFVTAMIRSDDLTAILIERGSVLTAGMRPSPAHMLRKRVGLLFPGAAAPEPFQSVGHCLWAWLAGLFGAVTAWRLLPKPSNG